MENFIKPVQLRACVILMVMSYVYTLIHDFIYAPDLAAYHKDLNLNFRTWLTGYNHAIFND